MKTLEAPVAAVKKGATVAALPSAKTNGVDPLGQFAPRIGAPRDLPDDLAANHDYYLHGTRKQQPRRGRWLGRAKPAKPFTSAQLKRFNETLDALAAETSGLPPDLAKHHNHYLHGHPKP